jgi:hypothetical protein
MSEEDQTKTLVEKIDDAIELAEDLGLAFVAGILMMARLELVQTKNGPATDSGNNRHS